MPDTIPMHDSLADLMPKDPLMAASWAGGLQHLLTRDDWMEAFRTETGQTWKPSNAPIEQMVDEATGRPLAFFRALAAWYNENLWGMKDGKVMDIGNMPAGDWSPEGRDKGPAKKKK